MPANIPNIIQCIIGPPVNLIQFGSITVIDNDGFGIIFIISKRCVMPQFSPADQYNSIRILEGDLLLVKTFCRISPQIRQMFHFDQGMTNGDHSFFGIAVLDGFCRIKSHPKIIDGNIYILKRFFYILGTMDDSYPRIAIRKIGWRLI